MDKVFLLKFAFRNLLMHKSRTILTLLGVTIGISAMVFLVSFAYGIENLVTKEVTGGDALRLVDVGTGSSQVVKLGDDSLEKISSISGVSRVETTINVAAKLKDENRYVDSTLSGSTNKYLNWSGENISVGNYYQDGNLGQIVINESSLKFLQKDKQEIIGKTVLVDIIVPKQLTDDGESLVIENREFEITGVTKDATNPVLFVSKNVLTDLGVTTYSQAKVELEDDNNSQVVRRHIENLGFKTEYVGDTVSQIEQVFSVFKLILGSFGLIALIVASLGMFNTLTISLLERMKEFALLKILGMHKKDVNLLFWLESIFFGIFGGLVGIVLGMLCGSLFNLILNKYAVSSGGEAVSVFYFSPWFILGILGFSVFVSILTGLYPSAKAAKANALDVMRYE